MKLQHIATKNTLHVAFLAVYFLLFPADLWAVACNVVFSNAVQATAANGNMLLSYHSVLTGGGTTLQGKTLTDNTAWAACSGGNCNASGVAAATSTPTFLTGTQSDGAINIPYKGQDNYGQGDYASVTVGQEATLKFNSHEGVYKTGAFTTNYLSEVHLQPGDYWINGDLNLGQGTIIRRLAASGSTRIFVKGNITMGYQVKTQGYSSDQLLIYATGSITTQNEVNLSAFVYAGGNASFAYNSVVNGAVSGANFIASDNQVTVNYQPSALNSASFAPFCSGVASVDHYELQLPSSALACMGADVAVRACLDSAVPCTLNSTIGSNVSLTTSAGSLAASTFALVNGLGATKLSYPTASDGAATVTLASVATAATNPTKCCTSSSSCAVANSCTTNFKAAGFVFSSSTSDTIPTEVAGTTDNNVYLRALQSDKTTGACVARFSAPQTVQLAYKCVNPSNCIAGEVLTLNGVGIPGNANTASPVTYGNVSLNFTSSGAATIPLNYSDVGQVQLLASLSLPQTANDPAYTLSGVSNGFVVKPFDLVISSVQSASGADNPATTTSSTGFIPSGTSFKVAVEARSAVSGHITPNYGRETTPESVILQVNNLISPAGGVLGTLSNANAFVLSGTAKGHFDNTSVNWDEVGTLGLKAQVADSDYLGTGNLVSTAVTNVGRFYPDHFTLTNASTANACLLGVFSYMGQPGVNLNYALRAENINNTLVRNYGLSYVLNDASKLATPIYVAENADAGSDLGARLSAVAAVPASWSSGVYSFASTQTVFNRQISGAPDGPLSSLQLGLKLSSDLDGRSFKTTALNMDAATSGTCSSCTAVSLGTSLNLRYGRLRLDDAFGPETVVLPVNFVTEYWTGNHFSLNANDSCTLVPRTAINYPAGSLAVDANRSVNLGGGSTQGIYALIDPLASGGVHFTAGTAGQYFTAPTGGATGSFIVGIDFTNLSWLTYDWNQDHTYTDTSLTAKFSFGSYRGNDRVIYWREKLQ